MCGSVGRLELDGWNVAAVAVEALGVVHAALLDDTLSDHVVRQADASAERPARESRADREGRPGSLLRGGQDFRATVKSRPTVSWTPPESLCPWST